MTLPVLVGVLLQVWVGTLVSDDPPHKMPIVERRVENLRQWFGEGIGEHDEMDIPQQNLFTVVSPVAMHNVDCKAGIDEVHQQVAVGECSVIAGVGMEALEFAELLYLSIVSPLRRGAVAC